MNDGNEPIFNPVKEYETYAERFREVAERTFQELVTASGVGIEANRALCREIDSLREGISRLKSKIGWRIAWCVLLWIVVGIGVWRTVADWDWVFSYPIFLFPIAAALSLTLLLAKVHPALKRLRKERKQLEQQAADKERQAWQQMEPLNSLYDWDIFSRMMTETLPRMQFDPFFTTQRLADLVHTYGWDETFSQGRSVLFSHSGLINGNPFVLCRTRKQVWGSKEYTGSITIHWTETTYDSDGKPQTVHRSQVLTATVSKPFPLFPEKTRLIYGNTSAPNLTFDRTKNKFSHKEGSLTYKLKKRKLEHKSQNLKKDYAMSNNEEFEVLFTADNRTDNQQFFLLFTPLAQEAMIDLIRDSEKVGYGDDFDFHKQQMINTIISDHVQDMSLDMNPSQFADYSFDTAQKRFSTSTLETFRAIYFALAPLMCVPLYQQMRPLSDIYGRDMAPRSSYWEHESLANFWGESHFRHSSCVTSNILKTSESRTEDGQVTIHVQAHGYRAEPRVDYISKMGGDGRVHTIPVYWDEYLPVVGEGSFVLREDLEAEPEKQDPIIRKQSIDRKRSPLGEASIYRRHITSVLK